MIRMHGNGVTGEPRMKDGLWRSPGRALRAGRARWLAGAFVILFLSAGPSCTSFKTPSEDAVAVVNGTEIKVKDFTVKLRNALNLLGHKQALKPEDLMKIKREALDDLIEEKLMLLRAEQLGIKVTDEELKTRVDEIRKDYSGESFAQIFGGEKVDYTIWSEELRKRLVLEKLIVREVNARISITDDEAQAYYQANRTRYYAEETVHVAQIVLQQKEKADAAYKRLQGGEDFGALAREVSTGPESAKGGDLGVFTRGIMPEAFDRIVFSLPEGRFSRVVKSPYGFHIFKVLNREKGHWIEFADVKEKIKADLMKGREEEAYRRWLEGLKSEAKIRVNEERLRQVQIEERTGEPGSGQTAAPAAPAR